MLTFNPRHRLVCYGKAFAGGGGEGGWGFPMISFHFHVLPPQLLAVGRWRSPRIAAAVLPDIITPSNLLASRPSECLGVLGIQEQLSKQGLQDPDRHEMLQLCRSVQLPKSPWKWHWETCRLTFDRFDLPSTVSFTDHMLDRAGERLCGFLLPSRYSPGCRARGFCHLINKAASWGTLVGQRSMARTRHRANRGRESPYHCSRSPLIVAGLAALIQPRGTPA